MKSKKGCQSLHFLINSLERNYDFETSQVLYFALKHAQESKEFSKLNGPRGTKLLNRFIRDLEGK